MTDALDLSLDDLDDVLGTAAQNAAPRPVARASELQPIVAPKTKGPAELLRILKIGEAFLCIGYNRHSVRVATYRLAPKRFLLTDAGDEFQVWRIADDDVASAPPMPPKRAPRSVQLSKHEIKARAQSQARGGPLAFVREIQVGQSASVSPHNPASVKAIVTGRRAPGRFELTRERIRGHDLWRITRLA
jgi:hypothetical protein